VSHLPENTVDREPRGLMIGGQTQDRAYQLAQAVVNGAQEFIHNASRGGGRMDELVHHHAEKQVGLILVLKSAFHHGVNHFPQGRCGVIVSRWSLSGTPRMPENLGV